MRSNDVEKWFAHGCCPPERQTRQRPAKARESMRQRRLDRGAEFWQLTQGPVTQEIDEIGDSRDVCRGVQLR